MKNTEFCPIESLLGMKTDQELLDDFVESAENDEQGSAARFLHSVYLCDLYDYYKRKDWATVRLDDELLGKLHQCPEWSYNIV